MSLGITEVIRGQDLAKAMNSQLAIIDALGQKPLLYKHVPLFTNNVGEKLAKREGSKGLQNLQMKGLMGPDVIGVLASTLNLVPEGSVLSAEELLSDLMTKKDWIQNFIKPL